MLTQADIEAIAQKLNQHADEVHGRDDIMNGLVRHLIRHIEADLTQIWFYGDALKSRAEQSGLKGKG